MGKKKSSPAKAKRPTHLLQKPLKAEFKGLFKAVAKGLVHFTVGKWATMSTDIVDGIAAIGLRDEPGERAWLLLQRAMTAAILDLTGEVHDLLHEPPDDVDKLCDQTQRLLGDYTVEIDKIFFERPAELPLVAPMQCVIGHWMTGYGLDEKQAESVAARLPSFFVYALHREWADHRDTYKGIRESIDSPFSPAVERQQQWDSYGAWLNREVDRRMFYESFGLRQVFVPLRGYTVTKANETDLESSGLERGKREALNVRDALDAWLEEKNRSDAIRVISGGPGSGKSSFSRIYAADLLNNGMRVVYVPLHQLNLKDQLESAFDDFCRRHELLPEQLLDADAGEQDLFIIFDGLDELSKQGAAAQAVASQFVREVERAVRDRNQAELHVRVLLNGRPVAIQSNELEFRREGQVIHLLPFYLTEEEAADYRDPLKLLTGEHHDQRDEWWCLYGKATGRDYGGLPKELQRGDLREVTREPLLNYLVAITVERGELDFSKDVNINQIYRDLLSAVFKRDWEGRQFETIRSLKQHEFERVLEEIALATWHGDGRTTTVKAIIDHCAGSGVAKLLEAFQGGAETGAASLLAAFYFRRHGQVHGEDTFEFTHKSFGEYLVARRVFRAVKKVDKDLRARDEDLDAGTDEVAALEHWIAIFGATSFDGDLLRYIVNEFRLVKRDAIVPLHDTLVRLLSFELRHGLPIKELSRLGSFDMAREQANNAEGALMVLRSLCAVNAEVVSMIDWPTDTAAGELLCRIRGQRTGPSTMATESMSRLDLASQKLFCCDLYGADLSFSISFGAGLAYAVLEAANLGWANLQHASFLNANLQRAFLRNAKLEGAKFKGANLLNAKFEDANLQGANLKGANLQGANLQGALLQGALLQGANLQGANLQGANLEGANLEGALLEGALLEDANLRGAIGLPRDLK